jgi:hypothetical protein
MISEKLRPIIFLVSIFLDNKIFRIKLLINFFKVELNLNLKEDDHVDVNLGSESDFKII